LSVVFPPNHAPNAVRYIGSAEFGFYTALYTYYNRFIRGLLVSTGKKEERLALTDTMGALRSRHFQYNIPGTFDRICNSWTSVLFVGLKLSFIGVAYLSARNAIHNNEVVALLAEDFERVEQLKTMLHATRERKAKLMEDYREHVMGHQC